jgi:hypothetical protein
MNMEHQQHRQKHWGCKTMFWGNKIFTRNHIMQLRLLTSNLTELSTNQLPTPKLSASQHTISRKVIRSVGTRSSLKPLPIHCTHTVTTGCYTPTQCWCIMNKNVKFYAQRYRWQINVLRQYVGNKSVHRRSEENKYAQGDKEPLDSGYKFCVNRFCINLYPTNVENWVSS